MDVRAELNGSAVVLSLGGRLTVEEDARRLHVLVRSAARLHPNVVVLDLGRIRQIDCSGIGQLVRVWHEAHDAGVEVALADASDTVRRLLAMFGLLALFGSGDDRGLTRRPPLRSGCRVALNVSSQRSPRVPCVMTQPAPQLGC